MSAKTSALWISLLGIALLAGLSVTRAQTMAQTDIVTAISNLENDAVKADLAGDADFYQKVLAEDWTRGDSDGTYFTKAVLLNLMADTKSIKTNSEQISMTDYPTNVCVSWTEGRPPRWASFRLMRS